MLGELVLSAPLSLAALDKFIHWYDETVLVQ